MTNPQPVTLTRFAGSDPDLHHVYCCDPNLAYCGADITDHQFIDPSALITCVVCVELEELDAPCRVCGQ